MNISKEDLGIRIRNVRNKRLESMEKFGQAISKATNNEVKSGKSNVSRWERGENIPNNETIKAIAELGKITVDELLYGSIEEFITRTANEEMNRLEQERIENGDRLITPTIKKAWLDEVINAEIKEVKDIPGSIDYADVADSIKRYLNAKNDFAFLIPSEAAEVIKANNLSSKELLHDVAPLADPKTYEEIIQHYDRIDDLLPKLEQ